jgi:hypothetical protein
VSGLPAMRQRDPVEEMPDLPTPEDLETIRHPHKAELVVLRARVTRLTEAGEAVAGGLRAEHPGCNSNNCPLGAVLAGWEQAKKTKVPTGDGNYRPYRGL